MQSTFLVYIRQIDRHSDAYCTLSISDVLVANYAAHVEPRVFEPIVSDAVLLLNDADLYLTQLVLTLLCHLLRAWPPSAAGAPALAAHLIKQLWTQLPTLVLSAWLQGAAMHALQRLVAQLALNRFSLVSFQELLQARSLTHSRISRSFVGILMLNLNPH